MNALLSFIYGVLVKIVDDIYDNNILLKYKYLFVSALLLLTAYIIFFTKDLYILWAPALVGCVPMNTYSPHRCDFCPGTVVRS